MTVTTIKNIQTFINTCLRRILQTRWPDRISNEEFGNVRNNLQKKKPSRDDGNGVVTHSASLQLTSSLTRQPLAWNPQGKRKSPRPH
ncbi:hypothetical protein ACOMHN_004516 [Nucella lapillus]